MRISRLVPAVLALMLGAQAFASRSVLTPDGVSYLDLARAVRDGHWSRFINGYWSPLYPLLISAIAPALPDRFELLLALHVLNAAALGGAVVAVAWSARAVRPVELRWLAPLAVGGLMVAFDLVRATSPDALLALLATLVAVNIARHPGALVTRGVLYALMYLVKTSTLPWLVFVCSLELIRERQVGRLGRALRLTAPVAAVVLIWLGALSFAENRVTAGSTASLNWEWYGRGIRSRFPDTDPAGHRAYSYPALSAATAPDTALEGAETVRLADFGPTVATYLPWTDPARWSRGRIPLDSGPANPVLLTVERGADNLWVNGLEVLGWSFATLVLLACWWPQRSSKTGSWVWTSPGAWLVGSGLVGTVIMCLVHVEQRLVLPWLVLLVLGALLTYERPMTTKKAEPERVWRWPAGVRVVAVVAVAISSATLTGTAFRKDRLESQRAVQREAARAVHGAALSAADSSVVLVGPATALIPELWLHGRRVEAQLVDAAFAARPDAERQAILGFLAQRYRGRAGSMWVINRRSAGVEQRAAGPDITTYVDVVNIVKIE